MSTYTIAGCVVATADMLTFMEDNNNHHQFKKNDKAFVDLCSKYDGKLDTKAGRRAIRDKVRRINIKAGRPFGGNDTFGDVSVIVSGPEAYATEETLVQIQLSKAAVAKATKDCAALKAMLGDRKTKANAIDDLHGENEALKAELNAAKSQLLEAAKFEAQLRDTSCQLSLQSHKLRIEVGRTSQLEAALSSAKRDLAASKRQTKALLGGNASEVNAQAAKRSGGKNNKQKRFGGNKKRNANFNSHLQAMQPNVAAVAAKKL
jgi:hypothetical protein